MFCLYPLHALGFWIHGRGQVLGYQYPHHYSLANLDSLHAMRSVFGIVWVSPILDISHYVHFLIGPVLICRLSVRRGQHYLWFRPRGTEPGLPGPTGPSWTWRQTACNPTGSIESDCCNHLPGQTSEWNATVVCHWVSLFYGWTNGWVNTRDARDLRLNRAHCDVTVMIYIVAEQCHNLTCWWPSIWRCWPARESFY